MKKILFVIPLFITFNLFANTFYDGYYRILLNTKNKTYEMDIIVRNNDIFSTSFDIKNKNGRSLIFGNIDAMDEKISIETRLKKVANAEYIYINSDEDTKNIQRIYYYLIEKIENNEQGRYILEWYQVSLFLKGGKC